MKTLDTFQLANNEIYSLIEDTSDLTKEVYFKITRNLLLLHICDDKAMGYEKFYKIKNIFVEDHLLIWKEVKHNE